VSPESTRKSPDSFTLVELVSVIAIIGVLTALLIPVFNGLRGARSLADDAQTIADLFDQARTHAIANNTYVWIGIYEESENQPEPTNATPPYPGRGRVILATVASRDGTTACQDSSSSSSNRIPLIASQIVPVGKLIRIENIHLTDIGPPSSSSSPNPSPNSITGRPSYPYVSGNPTLDYQNRISSDDVHSPFNQTLYPFVAHGYTFYKTIRFNPRGEASINSTYALRRVAEIGLRSAHGDAVDLDSANSVAIQFSGLAGKCKVYRK
jgi:type II secretory pathway pseudopilin PulG